MTKTSDALAEINKTIFQNDEPPPLVRLKNGMEVRTGTIATLIQNISLYNAATSEDARRQIEEAFQAAIPTLFIVGLFDLFWTSPVSVDTCSNVICVLKEGNHGKDKKKIYS